MASGGKRLGHVKPRERAGAETAQKYEFQYQRTARAALTLLDDAQKHVCVYCDWHDDFVIEGDDPPTRYYFHQVKGRKSSQKPWSFRELFGVAYKNGAKPTTKPPAVFEGAVFPFMLLHHHNFADSCAGLAFVTNAGFEATLSGFICDVANAPDISVLPPKTRIAFDHLARAYAATTPPLITEAAELLAWLHGLKLHAEQGKLDDENAALLELGDVVEQFSEIDLLQSQSKMIARQIIARVRAKASHSTTTIPTDDDILRQNKGIVVGELLSILSLSADGYEALKSGVSGQTVKTLSRLQRYCQKNNLVGHVVEICCFKAAWDTWRTAERHFMKTADYVTLANNAKGILQAGYQIDRMVDEAKAIAGKFHGLTATPLTGEHVLGLMFSLAANTDHTPPTIQVAR